MTRAELLKQIMAVGLLLDELRLFLDTHPENQQAQTDYFQNLPRRAQLIQQYTYLYGPLVWDQMNRATQWPWTEGHWPWEREA